MQTKSVSYTPSETAISDTVTPDTGYDGISSLSVSVRAVDSSYVGTGITRRSGSDLEVWDEVVVVPAGYYEQESEASVTQTTIAKPTATKGSVSNHSVTVTPSVTQTAGYISSGTKTGTAVTVTASELVSGTKSITANGTGIDVTNYASVNVSVSGGGVTGEVLWANWDMVEATYDRNGTVHDTGLSVTVQTAGTYKVKAFLRNTYTSTMRSSNARFYKNNTAVGSQHNIAPQTSVLLEETITCAAGDVIKLYANSAYSSTYFTFCYGLFVCPV